MYQALVNKKETLAVIGLGYVGLPIALAFARHFKVVGFDINAERIEMLKNNIDPSNEMVEEDFKNADISFTCQLEDLETVGTYVVAVPTPIDQHKVPNLKPLLSATESVAKVLSQGNYVIFESTVYPGCTEEECIPILEEISELKFNSEFKVGYSPERINPGDKLRPISKIVKVVSGCCKESLENIAKIYESIIDAGVHRSSTIKVAEAAKIIENTQRDLNIALMNELAIIFDKMDIDIWEVLEAANTKWNFGRYYPGLVGGHCIGVDPYYLTYKAKEIGFEPEVILSGRRINDEMSSYITKKAMQLIIRAGKFISRSKVLVMGATFKENVSDIRNSKVFNLIKELESFNIKVHVIDPHASSEEMQKEYGISLTEQLDTDYDCVVIAVSHDEYSDISESYLASITSENGILIDLKGIYKARIRSLTYWSL